MKPGPAVTINGVVHKTIIDEHGTQRFPSNAAIRWIFNHTMVLNDLRANYPQVDDDLRELYRLMGYSICGYEEVFEDDVIENPLWKEALL